jgi:hypothetical protein
MAREPPFTPALSQAPHDINTPLRLQVSTLKLRTPLPLGALRPFVV